MSDVPLIQSPLISLQEMENIDSFLNWGNYKPPTKAEWDWIKLFGKYPDFDPSLGRMSERVTIEVADLKLATRIIICNHYLHRGRTMAQLPYWIKVDNISVGVVLYSYPRLSQPLYGIRPLNLLELARMWISPDVQGQAIVDSSGKQHAVSIASNAISKTVKYIRQDWVIKYPKLPDIYAIISWSDNVHHEGTIYKASNFVSMGQSGGSLHGSRRRSNGGRDQLNPDYEHTKTVWLYKYSKQINRSTGIEVTDSDKDADQIELFTQENINQA
jgi:hypothetical protein